ELLLFGEMLLADREPFVVCHNFGGCHSILLRGCGRSITSSVLGPGGIARGQSRQTTSEAWGRSTGRSLPSPRRPPEMSLLWPGIAGEPSDSITQSADGWMMFGSADGLAAFGCRRARAR